MQQLQVNSIGKVRNDGTPIIDLKPYTPSLDRIETPGVPEMKRGFRMRKILCAAFATALLFMTTACDRGVNTADQPTIASSQSSSTPTIEEEEGREASEASVIKSAVDMAMFDNLVAATAEGKLNRDWSLFQTEAEQMGYTPSVAEGQFTIVDPANPGSYIYGDISDESIAFIGYHLLSGNADRRVEVRFSSDEPQYYFEITPFFSGNRADNLDAIRSWLEYGYNGD